jgi:hypothetical protein
VRAFTRTAYQPRKGAAWHAAGMELECRRCHRAVKVSAAQFEVFERMHYVCFHYEFEHGEFDVHEECTAGGCPSASLAKGRDRVIATARDLAEETALGAPWTNAALHEYLEAFASWLDDSDGYYLNRRTVPPGNGWQVVNDALSAATVYE